MEVTAIINRKGGVGKTATAHNLGAGLQRKKNKVLYIDLDSQTNLTYTMDADVNGLTIQDVIEDGADINEAIQHTAQGDIIPGAPGLATADSTLTATGKEYRLKEALDGLKAKYDYIIIDTPAQLGILTVNALTAATNAIIPVQAEIYSLQGIGLLNETIEAVKKYTNPLLYIKGILTTRYNKRAVISRDMQSNLEDLAKKLYTTCYKTPIRECTAIKEAQAMQTDIFSYAPKSNAAADYTAFVKEYLKP
jgi:chromosome partitioning protein